MKQRPPLPSVLIRVKLDVAAFGPGKADLLDRIAETGSISAAARQMRMSYKRAWQLVDEMNHMFTQPLIEAAPGGVRGGGATLTPLGARIAAAYRRIQEKLPLAARRELALLAKFAANRN